MEIGERYGCICSKDSAFAGLRDTVQSHSKRKFVNRDFNFFDLKEDS